MNKKFYTINPISIVTTINTTFPDFPCKFSGKNSVKKFKACKLYATQMLKLYCNFTVRYLHTIAMQLVFLYMTFSL